jgi:hypothetical protein
VVATVVGAIGCGGGGAGGTAAIPYVYASGDQIDVAAGACQIVRGPEDVACDGSMHDEVDDIGYSGTSDILEVALIPDSFFHTYQCGFTADQTLFDGDVISSSAGTPSRGLRRQLRLRRLLRQRLRGLRLRPDLDRDLLAVASRGAGDLRGGGGLPLHQEREAHKLLERALVLIGDRGVLDVDVQIVPLRLDLAHRKVNGHTPGFHADAIGTCTVS